MTEDAAEDFSDDQAEGGGHGPRKYGRREGRVVMAGVAVPVRMAMGMRVAGPMAVLMGMIVVGGTGNNRGVRFTSHKGIVRAEGRVCSQRSCY